MVMYILLANRCKKGDKFRLTHWHTQTLNANQNKRIYVEERERKKQNQIQMTVYLIYQWIMRSSHEL